jgi:hypothetical protein
VSANAQAMREALEHIVAGAEFECERLTTGIGSCFRTGWTPDAKYWSDRCCPACIAHVALYAADKATDLEEASKLLQHSDKGTTRRHYRGEVEKIKPVR